MRISDWSSDVCSSDLAEAGPRTVKYLGADQLGGGRRFRERAIDIEPWIAGGQRVCTRLQPCDQFRHPLHQRGQLRLADQEDDVADAAKYRRQRHDHDDRTDRARDLVDVLRSEEHTSELQSLLRIS